MMATGDITGSKALVEVSDGGRAQLVEGVALMDSAGTHVGSGAAGLSVTAAPVPWNVPFTHYLTDDGLSTGASAANGDYSATATRRHKGPGAGVIWYVHCIRIALQDLVVGPGGYGGLSALANGVEIRIEDTTGPTTINTLVPAVKTGNDWFLMTGQHATLNASEDASWYTLDCVSAFGGPIRLDGDNGGGDRLSVFLFDDFSGLTNHAFAISGRIGSF